MLEPGNSLQTSKILPSDSLFFMGNGSAAPCAASSAWRGVVADRLRLLAKLPVEKLIKGTNSFGSYIGALYADNLVVFENMNYGNAMYVLYNDWQDVSKRSELRSVTRHDESL